MLRGEKVGSWSFLIGVLVAGVFAFIGPLTDGAVYILISLGILLGILNLINEETERFLTAGAVIVIVSALGQAVVSDTQIFGRVLSAIAMLFIPLTIFIALKHVFSR